MTNEKRPQTIEEILRMLTELNQSVLAMLASQEVRSASQRENNKTLEELNQSVLAMLASHKDRSPTE